MPTTTLDATTRLAIGGMSCAACVARVERALRAVPGVSDASVSLATERAEIRASRAVTTDTLLTAVRSSGYLAESLMDVSANASASTTLHQRDFRGWHVLAAAALTLPLLLPMLAMPFGYELALPGAWQGLLSTIVQFGFGARFYRAGWSALRARSGNMDLLIAVGTTAAWALSTWLLLMGPADHAGLYFESSATVITLVLFGKWLEQRARRGAAASIAALAELRPATVRVVRDEIEQSIAIDDLRVRDLFVAGPGERIAADGIVAEGRSAVDESLITGESVLVDKAAGDAVIGGALNGNGMLKVRVRALGAESMLGQIIRQVENAQSAKPDIQRLVDRVSAVFVPVVLGIAVLTLFGHLLAGSGMQAALLDAVAVLVIACPCALGLATPAAIIVGIGAAARHGVLIRDPQALEMAHRVTHVVFDKTGTLTEGQPSLQALTAVALQEQHALSIALALQASNGHPLARALATAAAARGATPVAAASAVSALPGSGIEGHVEGADWLLGSARLMAQRRVDCAPLGAATGEWAQRGWTEAWLARIGPDTPARAVAAFAFTDRVRAGSKAAVAALTGAGLTVSMVSGDRTESVAALAQAVGIDDYAAETLPQGKCDWIEARRQRGDIVAMVGDGINDAPALAAADVGIAMAGGTDVALQTAAIALMRNDPRLVVAALDISRMTWRKIRQNLFWALIYNVVGIGLAASGHLDPMVSGLAMAFSSVSVIVNASLLRRWRPADTPASDRLDGLEIAHA